LGANKVVLFGARFVNQNTVDSLKEKCARFSNNVSVQTLQVSSLNDRRAYIGATAICAKNLFFEK
ncbi:MAG: hypothetical protein K2J16_04040, partial [Clostridia bacterium]|nr:hypothetical protein [Clostridia bacterium]